MQTLYEEQYENSIENTLRFINALCAGVCHCGLCFTQYDTLLIDTDNNGGMRTRCVVVRLFIVVYREGL